MKNNVFIILLFLLSFLYSCDPMDDRMVFYNNSSEDVFVRMIFIDEDVTGTMVGLRKIESNNEKRIGKLYTWETEFENSGDSILNVVIFNDYEFLNDKYEKSNKIKSDSLLKIGDYKVHSYKYRDLVKNNWQIKYPNDVFEKGKALNLNRKNNELKPSSEILKEKGIEDRWNKKDSL